MGRATPRGRPGRLDSESSWIKSSLSFSNGNCVEVASLPDGEIGVRDSKASDGPVLRFTSDEWHAFLGRVRNGEFDKFSQAWPPQDTGHVPSLQAWPSASPAAADQQDGPPHQDNRAGRGRRPSAFAAAGAAAAAIPAAPAIALAATGNPHAVPLLISSAVIGLVTVIAGAAVRIHDSAQQTRRLKIQLAGPTAIAEAMARCIDDTHTAAQHVRASRGAAEAASVRASNSQVLAEMMPAVLVAIGQQVPRAP